MGDEGEDRLVRLRPLLRMAATPPGLTTGKRGPSRVPRHAAGWRPRRGARRAARAGRAVAAGGLVAPIRRSTTLDHRRGHDRQRHQRGAPHARATRSAARKVAVLPGRATCAALHHPEFPRRRLGIPPARARACAFVRTGPTAATLHVRSPLHTRARSSARLPRRCSTGCLRACRARRSMQLPDRPGRLSGQFAGAIGRYWASNCGRTCCRPSWRPRAPSALS